MHEPRRSLTKLLLALPVLLVCCYLVMVAWTFVVLLLATGEELALDGLDRDALLSIFNPFNLGDEGIFLIWIPAALIILVQCAMLVPAARPVRRSGRPRSPWFAAITAGLLAGLLLVGVLFALSDMPRVAVSLGFTTGDGFNSAKQIGSRRVEAFWGTMPYLCILLLLGTWATWTTMLIAAMRRSPVGWFSRMVKWLIAGSVIELVLTLPLYVIVRRRYDCFCELPSFWAVVLGLMTICSLTGPGAVLVWRHRRGVPTDAWADRCLACGYRRTADASACCPECGTRWGRMGPSGGAGNPGADGG